MRRLAILDFAVRKLRELISHCAGRRKFISATNYLTVASGCVIANDANHKRCLLLAQRLTKTSGPHVLVTNHEAQHFPLKTGEFNLFYLFYLCYFITQTVFNILTFCFM